VFDKTDVIGVTPTMIRPPQGETEPRVERILNAMGIVSKGVLEGVEHLTDLRKLGLRVVKWNRDSRDFSFSSYTPGAVIQPPYNPNDTPDAISRQFSTWARETPQQGTISLRKFDSLKYALNIKLKRKI
jgi:hypothetical protein